MPLPWSTFFPLCCCQAEGAGQSICHHTTSEFHNVVDYLAVQGSEDHARGKVRGLWPFMIVNCLPSSIMWKWRIPLHKRTTPDLMLNI